MTMSRSPMMSAAAGSAAIAQSSGATRAKGPLVWLDMDQQALDDAYDQEVYAPNRDQVGKRRIANSEQGARRHRRAAARRVRPDRDRESSTSTGPARPNAPINIFIHGGAWRANRGRRLRVPGGAVRQCRRALRHPRLHQCRRRGRQPVPDGRAGAARGRLGLQQRRSRSAAIPTALSVVAFVRLASVRLRADHRLAQG